MGKIGKCPKCPAGARDVLLIGGLCHNHFNGQNDARADAPKKKPKGNSLTMKEWFAMQELQVPRKCENCGGKIATAIDWIRRAAIAHIVPKARVKSVATHPMNRWFACVDCHTNFDNWPSEKVMKMPIVQVCRERLKIFFHLIPESELKHVREYLRPDVNL